MINLDNKTYLITGSTSGIGLSTSLYLLEKTNANIVAVGRDEDKLHSIFDNHSERCQVVVHDLNDICNIHAIFSELKCKLDGLVHCAGLSPLMKIEENDVTTMIKTFNVNFFAFIELCKYFFNTSVSNENSSIVAMSSIAASVVPFRQTVYSSSKAALEQAIRCIAKEFMSRKIRVNGIAAGAVETEMLECLCSESEGLREKLNKYYPLGLIPVQEIAKMIVFLLSPVSSHLSGTVNRVDSGFYINK